jgi:hypothetical protein
MVMPTAVRVGRLLRVALPTDITAGYNRFIGRFNDAVDPILFGSATS